MSIPWIEGGYADDIAVLVEMVLNCRPVYYFHDAKCFGCDFHLERL